MNLARVPAPSDRSRPDAAPRHRARVLVAPVPGVFSTDIDSDRRFSRHWHDAYGFGLLEQGAQAWHSDRGVVYGYAGDVISTNPGEVHDGRPLGGATRRWRIVFMAVDAMSRAIDRAPAPAIARPVIHDPRLAAALRRLFRRLDREHGGHDAAGARALACEEALVTACVHLMAEHGSTAVARDAPSHPMVRVRDRLADDAADPPTLADLALLVGVSRYHLLRQFQRAYGIAPHQWLLRRRAERARLLVRDGAPLAEAASDCGFADQSHMTRVFLRQFGYTPGAWQRAHRRQ